MSNPFRFAVLLLLALPMRELWSQSQSPSSAQPAAATPAVALDLGIGGGRGFGRPVYANRAMLSGSALLSWTVRPLRYGALIVAASASANAVWGFTDCLAGEGDPSFACAQYPSDVSVGVLGGWARRVGQESGLRVLAGPAYFNRNDGKSGIGLIGRADGAQQLTSWLSLVFWAQGGLPPSASRTEDLYTVAGGLGLRLY